MRILAFYVVHKLAYYVVPKLAYYVEKNLLTVQVPVLNKIFPALIAVSERQFESDLHTV